MDDLEYEKTYLILENKILNERKQILMLNKQKLLLENHLQKWEQLLLEWDEEDLYDEILSDAFKIFD